MRKHPDSANTLLMELLVVILFFMLCMTTVVEAFGTARLKSMHATAAGNAMLRAENLAERFYAGQTPDELLTADGFRWQEDQWILEEKNYTLTAAVSEEATEAGTMRRIVMTARRGEETLFELPVSCYAPGEVAP